MRPFLALGVDMIEILLRRVLRDKFPTEVLLVIQAEVDVLRALLAEPQADFAVAAFAGGVAADGDGHLVFLSA